MSQCNSFMEEKNQGDIGDITGVFSLSPLSTLSSLTPVPVTPLSFIVENSHISTHNKLILIRILTRDLYFQNQGVGD